MAEETDLAIVEKQAAPVNQDALKVADIVDSFTIADNQSLQMAMTWVAAVKKEFKKAEALRDSSLKPMKAAIKAVNGYFKPGLDALKKCETELKSKAVMFVDLATKRRDDLLASVVGADNATEIMKQADALIIEEMPGLSIREPYWTGEITDRDAFVQWAATSGNYAFLQPDLAAIKKRTKLLSSDPEWPGWKAFTKRVIAITVDKIGEKDE